MNSLDELVQAVQGRTNIPKVAVARCADDFVLKAAMEAYEKKVVEPVLIGDMAKAKETAAECGLDISQLQSFNISSDEEAVTKAVELFKNKEADLIMKGKVSTATLLKAILDKKNGVPSRGLISHVTVFPHPHEERLMLLTDAGVNIKPNLQRKADIIKNSLEVARALKIARPKVAVLAATEKVNYPAMPATLDADMLSRMADNGDFGDAAVCGPLALDLAISEDSARRKNVQHEVAGKADVLVPPDIESANILYKAVGAFFGLPLASVVVGSSVPVVVPSRADSKESRFYSLALAAYLTA
ncbi:MAG: bifunctional enoyl-CoA hydratase/phosphate acetyltransferase [Desulfovibrio sp.]